MPDLSIRKTGNKTYTYSHLDDMYNDRVPPVSGMTLVMKPTLATADDDIAYFISTEHRVVVKYPWYPSEYRNEEGNLPDEWVDFDEDDDTDWPDTSCIKYYEDGKLIDEWVWQYE